LHEKKEFIIFVENICIMNMNIKILEKSLAERQGIRIPCGVKSVKLNGSSVLRTYPAGPTCRSAFIVNVSNNGVDYVAKCTMEDDDGSSLWIYRSYDDRGYGEVFNDFMAPFVRDVAGVVGEILSAPGCNAGVDVVLEADVEVDDGVLALPRAVRLRLVIDPRLVRQVDLNPAA
jgi:hypothetical protein